ncbi:tRNA pseudouridine(38-40) synthase TruA [Halalkalibacter nanhaiisediminis]|uniref:tRNA pseudouridine synthase A n=1 Tax=Halalkalibacter nanhaiisediminis TaxID=688079 RepID=A0A562QA65_9BACI|nr:tRNA pseudouridine(38-40) synthase TruA [Halalkalibacter nanhaiisediminis]TWI53655.1 tRNA pseudouridine38-40 synthase [Halalkalibacter nanhaiisediminis]
MNRVVLRVAYEGTAFSGYQVQPGKRTVQSEIEQAFMKIHKGEAIRVHSSGRTDTGVHARGQILHFDTSLTIPTERWPKALNSMLPDDIRVMEAGYVSKDFHSRYDAQKKHYRYRVLAAREEDVFRRNITYHVPYAIDLTRMQEAAEHLIGRYDFSSFCAANTDVQDKVRTLYEITIEREQDEIIFNLIGNGFLYNMVRIIVGTLLEVGAGKREPVELINIRDAKNRTYAGKTAPGHGLFLWQVYYETSLFHHD